MDTRPRILRTLGGLAVATALALTQSIAVSGQAEAPRGGQASDTWSPPRTADGRPDLHGVWANNGVTPLERPKQWAGKQFLTDAELEMLKQATAEVVEGGGDAVFGDTLILAALERQKNPTSTDRGTGNYNQFWLVERNVDDRRTSLIVDPPDGRLPALTPEGRARQAAAAERRRLHPADDPEDRGLGERCVNFGVPKLGAGYNSYYEIVQTPNHVVMHSEMAHDARIIPLDGRPHIEKGLRQWNGDARGRWEGDTLVVETTNFSPKSQFRESRENLHLVERFTRVGPNTLNYEVTVTDPTTWTQPWTAMIPLKKSTEPIYEYACHEGNHSLVGILRGHRVQEQADGAAAKTGSR
jgi:hypothetical protein